MMLIHGLLVTAEDDNVYSVRDCRFRLGHILRHYVPTDSYPAVCRVFNCFGENFDTLSDAVAEFLKIRGCRPRNVLGDCDE